jgi:hypothetical protein
MQFLSIGTTLPIFGSTVELRSLTIRELNSDTPIFLRKTLEKCPALERLSST